MFASYKDGKNRSIPHCFPKYPGWSTAQRTDKEDLHLKVRNKTVIISVFWRKSKDLANNRGSCRYGDLGLSNMHTASSSGRLNCRNLVSKNSTRTYYNTVNKCILITANKCIHIISAYFLAAASGKCMCLLTSLYGMHDTIYR